MGGDGENNGYNLFEEEIVTAPEPEDEDGGEGEKRRRPQMGRPLPPPASQPGRGRQHHTHMPRPPTGPDAAHPRHPMDLSEVRAATSCMRCTTKPRPQPVGTPILCPGVPSEG